MKQTRCSLILSLLCLVLLVIAGCSKKSVGSGDTAFQSASPELKGAWNSAMAAMKTNGYATAILQLQQLRAMPGLSAEQTKVVDENSTAISDQMYAAANKDDPAAKQAIQDLRNASRR